MATLHRWQDRRRELESELRTVADRIFEAKQDVGAVLARDDFGLAVGDRIRLSHHGEVRAEGECAFFMLADELAVAVMLRREDGHLSGYTLNKWTVEKVEREAASWTK